MGKKLNTALAGKLYMDGKSDKEIAEACGMTRETIRNWRQRCGLPANYEPKDESHLTQLEKDAIAARKAGLSYGQYNAQQFNNRRR